MKANGQIVTCTTVQSPTKDDLVFPNYVKMMEHHVHTSHKALTIKDLVVTAPEDADDTRLLHVSDDSLDDFKFPCDDIDEADKHDVDTYNRLVGAQAAQPRW